MPTLHDRIERTRLAIGAALMELRIHDERRARIITRAERAYAELVDMLGAELDDPKVIADQV